MPSQWRPKNSWTPPHPHRRHASISQESLSMQSASPTSRRTSISRYRRLTRGAAAVVLVALGASLVAAPAWSATKLPTPKAPVAQPAAAEGMQPYVPQSSCDPVMRTGIKKFRDLLLKTYDRGSYGGSTRECTAGGKSEHYEGRALDFMLSASNAKDKATADAIIAWMLKPGPDGVQALQARRLGIMYIMYNHRIWGVWSGKWKKITSGDPHTSHIHFSFSWAGAKARTSFWTGKVAAFDYGPCAAYKGQPARLYTKPNPTPCKTNLPAAPKSTHKVAWTGSRTADVAKAQALLKIPAAKRTKVFGTSLRKAVVAYQKAKKLPVTGALDKATWIALDPKSKLASPKPTTTTTTSSGNASAGKPPVSSWVTISYGATGSRVLLVQKTLKLAAAQCT